METVVRVAAIYLFLMMAFRTMGKRDVGTLAPFDLVILLLIPELVSQALLREDFSITNALIGVSTLLALAFLTSVASYLSPRAERVIEGDPTVLVRRGELVPQAMHRERITPGELFAQMHNSGLERLDQVEWAVLETDGLIAFVPRRPEEARRPRDKTAML
jgi:uncharacterized membrane protein YcaP (DUF421 family)